MLRYMQQATEAALGVGSGEFLDRFKAWGWFLDDLVLTPVNNLKNPAERIAKCRAAQSTRGHVALRDYRANSVHAPLSGNSQQC